MWLIDRLLGHLGHKERAEVHRKNSEENKGNSSSDGARGG